MFLVYVDDIAITGNHESKMKEAKSLLQVMIPKVNKDDGFELKDFSVQIGGVAN